ncbi:hypothetical protein OYT1_ch2256 [Ferriphaselus amnicola]|uniref:Uncharacterized protein n=1 Tax=Ferriphaselus amnicola TaxID=1188319 RepID=A0A2Z6GEJ4_9PROT|nr:hypothetical protein [Ferriphaselus amnicola]BBE51772.1 hypothetical protein OYT1_ch2256 [Ferriphaselus amnicola]
MQIQPYTASDYADAQRALLPPGAAFDWPAGGVGDALLTGMGAEPARVGEAAQQVLDAAIEVHRPKHGSWHISEYRRVAAAALSGAIDVSPRSAFRVGSHVGERIWSAAAHGVSFPVEVVTRAAFCVGSGAGQRLWSPSGPNTNFSVGLYSVDHLMGPLRVGSHVGDATWGARARHILRVRYYQSVVDPKPMWDALAAFKRAHVFLWFEDVTGDGGVYGQN